MAGMMYLGNQKVTPVIVQGGGGGYSELPSYQVVNGVPQKAAFELKGTEFSDITEVPDGLFNQMFQDSDIRGVVNFSSLVSVGEEGMINMFRRCSKITGVVFSSLKNVSYDGMRNTFNGNTGLVGTIDLSSVEFVDETGFYLLFQGCSNIGTILLSSLKTIGEEGLASMCRGCISLENIYFNSLTANSFLESSCLRDILSNTGTNVVHTLHFPSNLESTIQGLDGYPTFGGTSGYVILAFDLEPTE